jgi:outer membrane protein
MKMTKGLPAGRLLIAGFALLLAWPAGAALGQQRIGYIDSNEILNQIPEFATIQQNLDRAAQEWQGELQTRQRELERMFRDYQARELLYTPDERQARREEIVRAEEELERRRAQYFGPEGELFREQERMMRPLQERIVAAVDAVAVAEGYDYVFDKGGDYIFLFAREQFNLNTLVLQELGIDVTQAGRNQR